MSSASQRAERLLVIGSARVWACDVVKGRALAEGMFTEAIEAGNPDSLIASVRALLATQSPAAQLRIVISDSWLAAAEVPWTPVLLKEGQTHAYISEQVELLGLRPEDLRIAVDDAPFGQPRVANAIQRTLLEGFGQAAGEVASILASVRPLSAVVHEFAQSRLSDAEHALALIEEGAIGIVIVRDRRIQQIKAHRIEADAVREIEKHWRRMQLREPDLAGLKLYGVDLREDGAAVADSLEWLKVGGADAQSMIPLTLCARAASNGALAWQVHAPKPGRGQVAAALLAGAVLVASTGLAMREAQEVLALEAQLQTLEASSSIEPTRAPSRAEEEQLARLKQQLEIFDVPLDRLLLAIRPPKQIDAALLGLEMSMSRTASKDSSLRISGEARSSEAMTRYVDHLAHTSPLTTAHLARHEAMDSPVGVYRFVIEASWAQ